MSIKSKFDVVKYLGSLIFKKEIKKQKGILKISPGDKVKAEEKAKFTIRKLEENANINVNNLTKGDLELLAEDIVNPFKYAEKTVVKSADILPFKFKRSFAEELADAGKKGDFTRMQGIMKLDPRFKEVMKNFEKQKTTEKLIRERDLQTKRIPLDTMKYDTPEIAKLKGAERMNYLITSPEQTAKLLKKGVTSDDIIYAQDRYGMTAKDMIDAVDAGFKFPFADGGIAGMLGEPTYQDEDHRVPYDNGKLVEGENYLPPKNFYGVGLGPLLDEFMSEGRPRDEKGFHTTLNKNDLINLFNYLKEHQDIDIENELMFRFGRVDPDKNSIFHLGLGKDKAEIGFKKKFNEGGRVPLKGGKRVLEGLAKLMDEFFPGTTKIGKTSRSMAEKTQLKQAIAGFQEREKVAKAISEGPLPGERAGIDVPHMPAGFKLSREKLEQNFPELNLDQINEIMNLDREMQGRVITMLKNRRLDPDLYDELLLKHGDTLKFQGEFDKAIRRRKNASGGRVPMWLGGGLTAGKRTLAELLKYMSKGSSHGKTPSEMLQMINPKQFNEMLNKPEGIPSIAKEMIEKYTKEMKIDRAGMVEHLIGTGRRIKQADDRITSYVNEVKERFMKELNMSEEAAEKAAYKMATMLEQQLGKKVGPKITDQGLLEMENIGKNLATKDRKLNATGGRVPRSGGGIMKIIKTFFQKKPETLKEFIEKRKFLEKIMGKTKEAELQKMLEEQKILQKQLEKNPPFKFPDTGPHSDISKEIEVILNKKTTKHADGGVAGMLGE